MSSAEKDLVLLAESDPRQRRLTRNALVAAGYRITEVPDGAAALRSLYEQRPALAILASDLAVYDCWTVLARIREVSEMPVIVIGDAAGAHGAVQSLEAGADDYLAHPAPLPELCARVDALFRRSRCARPTVVTVVLGNGHLELDLDAHTVRSDGDDVAVTPLEFRLLTAFLRHPDQILSATQLLLQAWDDPTGAGPERVKFAVARLRAKLTSGGNADPITAVRGVGYRYHALSA